LIGLHRRAVTGGGHSEASHRPAGEQADITAIIAAMNPPSDQPKMVTIVCSSCTLQPPHIRSATMNPEAAPQNMPAAEASSP